ncbi:MAG: heavy-metal-associated domain-containing protein [Bacteroidales bacterium]
MPKHIFKTNINCNACKSAVTPFLEKDSRIRKWEVDLGNPEKTLTVEGENITGNEIMDLIIEAGYRIEKP